MPYDITTTRQNIMNTIQHERIIQTRSCSLTKDDEHGNGEFVSAAIAYAKLAAEKNKTRDKIALNKAAKQHGGGFYPGISNVIGYSPTYKAPEEYPWDNMPTGQGARRDLISAAALIVAEIERMDREEFKLFASDSQKAKSEKEANKHRAYEAAAAEPFYMGTTTRAIASNPVAWTNVNSMDLGNASSTLVQQP